MRRLVVAMTTVAAIFFGAANAHAAVQLSVTPHTAKAAGAVTVRAGHLAPHQIYFLLLVPDKKKSLQRFISAERADKHGAFIATVRLPAVPYCGSARVYLMNAKKLLDHVGIRVTGCNPKVSAPPPPPKH